MFSLHCPSCRRTVLLGNRRVEAIDNVVLPDGRTVIDVHLRCFCTAMVTVRTGRHHDKSDRHADACSPSPHVPSA